MHVKGHSGISSVYITSMIAKFLEACVDVKPNAHFSVFLGADSETVKYKFVKPTFQAKMYLRDVTRSLRHLQLRWLCARHIPSSPIGGMKVHFGALLDGKWVFGCRFGSDQPRIDATIYHLEFLHRLYETPGVSRLLGVLVDEEQTVTAFLAELPSKGVMSDFITEIDRFGQRVTMERRTKWCKQVVEIVANAHNNNLVIGTLGIAPGSAFGIDSNDDVMLYRVVSKTFSIAAHKPGVLPPEYRQMASPDGLVTANPETDIYQLGLLLWRIASKRCSLTRSFLCRVAGCISSKSCTAYHAEPIDLPIIDNDTPQYFRDVIAGCRTADPYERPSARSLLEMFPTDLKNVHIDCWAPGHIRRVEEMKERYGDITTCDECGDVIGDVRFHCDTCASGDYDICVNCISKGIHCLDEEHYLQESRKAERQRRHDYHSSVKEDGKRKVLEID
jgi:hypothetical protein